MKKIAAIFLLLIFTFNLVGYKCVIAFMSAKADLLLEAQIDSDNYNEDELLEIKVALNMPYQQRFTEFERHYGEIQIDGKTYNYVKRKIEGDTAIFKCIANISKQQLKEKENDFAKSNSPINNTDKKQNTALKTFSGDFDDKSFFDYRISDTVLSSEHFSLFTTDLNEGQSIQPFQPPRSC